MNLRIGLRWPKKILWRLIGHRGHHKWTRDQSLIVNRTMSFSRADSMLGLNILQGLLEVFKCLIQCYCTGWGYLNIYISISALAGGI